MTQKSTYSSGIRVYIHSSSFSSLSVEGGTLVMRTQVDPASMAGVLRAAVRAVNPQSAPHAADYANGAGGLAWPGSASRWRSWAAFAVLALLLAAVGLYGVAVLHGDGESRRDPDHGWRWARRPRRCFA